MRQQIQQERQQMQQQVQQLQQERQRMQQVGGPNPQQQERLRQAQPSPEQALGGPPGKWWDRPEWVQLLVLSADQQKKMDDVFQQSRLKLIDLNATLEKEQITMEPLIAADSPDEAKIVAQFDKVAQARAELEKANARMLLGIRRVLTQDQWNKLKAETRNPAQVTVRPQPGPAGRGPNGQPGQGRGPNGGPPPGGRGPGGPGNPPPGPEE
jgi:Spy/CpxP family protein refolding chaperone